MGHHHHMAGHSPSPSPFPPSYMPLGSNTVPLDSIYGMTADLRLKKDDFGVYQGINVASLGSGLSSGPTTPPMTAGDALDSNPPRDGLDAHLISALIQNDFKNVDPLFLWWPSRPTIVFPELIGGVKVKRRMQNREAQRRFRERKEQRQKTLQQKADDLRDEYQKLVDQHSKSTGEVSRLLQENDVLRSEVKSLRQQWRIMLAVLQRPQGSQSPPLLAGNPGFLDDIRCFLDELPDDLPHSPS